MEEKNKKRILIIDDEKPIVDILTYNLQKEGYEIIEAYDGEVGYDRAINDKPDLILLDVMLPKQDGLTVCRKVREKSSVPIIMLTAKEDVVDKIIGLEIGADDYITKPYSTRELIARIKANLRKVEAISSEITLKRIEEQEKIKKEEKKNVVVSFGDATIDFERYLLKVGENPIELTLREFELLKFLIQNKGQIFSREQLLEKVWGYDYYGDVRTVDVTVRRIREKIEKDSSSPEYILTKRGLGYTFNSDTINEQ
ncbi:MAG: response regulator transcription factor [Clostridiales bacterium]|nr:response regulator transcription factor [Clostridiales bacterium]